MTRKSLLFVLIFLLTCTGTAFSGTVSKEHASLAARNFYYIRANLIQNTALKDVVITAEQTVKYEGLTVYYTFSFGQKGFVSVSACDATIPVLCYSLEGTYTGLDLPPAYERWMLDYSIQIATALKNDIQPTASIAELWADLTSPQPALLSKNTKQVMPLLHTRWNQGKYYNDACPADLAGPDGKTYAGCVPTAMGQIMNYYRHPIHGTGSYTYVHPVYGTISADFGNTSYYWNDMPVEVLSRQTDSAVSLLLFHLGASVDLNYGPNGSGMFNHKAAFSLRTYFGYSPDCEYIFRDTTHHTNWKQLILDHLDQKKPLYYAGWADTINESGHAFVCDGYQDTTYFHFNWGWGGSLNGYFSIDNLTPGGADFTLDHELIINFYPDTSYPYPDYCQEQQVLKNVKGSLSDGSGPLNDYQNNTQCSWLIQPQDSTTQIKLTFLEFNTQQDSDRVVIYNGINETAPILGTYSGNTVPSVITTSGKALFMKFITNSDTVSGGWLAEYSCTLPSYCSGIVDMTTASGYFNDKSGNYNYHPNQTCRWRIMPAGAGAVTLHFHAFDIAPGDYVKITDLSDNSVLADLTGNSIPTDITCNSGQMLVFFKSFDNLCAQGFSASYTSSNGINDSYQGLALTKVFPNPADEVLHLEFVSEDESEIILSIHDLQGRILFQKTRKTTAGIQTETLNTSELPGGIFILKITTNQNTINHKIILE